MITVPTPVAHKWYGGWFGITTLEAIAADAETIGLQQGSPLLAVAQSIFAGPGTTRLPNYRFILLTQCLVVVEDPSEAVAHAKARTLNYQYRLAHGEISVTGAEGARGDQGEYGMATNPHTHGGPGGDGGPGGNAGNVYLFAQSIVSRSFALRADGGAGGSGGMGGYGGDRNPAIGRGGHGGNGSTGGNGGQARLIYHLDRSQTPPKASAQAGAAGPAGEGGLGGQRPPTGFTPDGIPIYPRPNPRAASGSRGGAGQPGIAGTSELVQLESQVGFWETVRSSFPNHREQLFKIYHDHLEGLSNPTDPNQDGRWVDYIGALKEILKYFDANNPPVASEFFNSCRADGFPM